MNGYFAFFLLFVKIAFGEYVSPSIAALVKTPMLEGLPPKYGVSTNIHADSLAESETANTNPLLSGLNDEVWKVIKQKLEPRLAKLETGLTEASKDRTELRDSLQKTKEQELSDESGLKARVQKTEASKASDKLVMDKVEQRLKSLNKEIGTKVKPLEDFISEKKSLLNNLEGMAKSLNIHVGDSVPAVPAPVTNIVEKFDNIAISTAVKKEAAPISPELKKLNDDFKRALPKIPEKLSATDLTPNIKPNESATADKPESKPETDADIEKKLEKIERASVKKFKKHKKEILEEFGVSSGDAYADELFGVLDDDEVAVSKFDSSSNFWKTAFFASLLLNVIGALYHHSQRKHGVQIPLLSQA